MSLKITKQGSVTIITLNRPAARNAVNLETAVALHQAFLDFDSDKDASVAVLAGAGGHFCAGADLKELGSPEQAEQWYKRLGDESTAPLGPTRMLLSKPVIAAISGYAVAGGLELACWCDLRIMEESATLGVFCRRWGVPLIDGGTIRLPRLIGMSRAMDLILTGRPVVAQEAFDMGLANRLVPDGKALEVALELAGQIATFPQTCLRNDRISAYKQWDIESQDAFKHELECGLKSVQSMGTLKGAQKFSEGAGRHGEFED